MSGTPVLPRVSLVISTLDRAPYLRRLLASLGHLDHPSFEVVVVNGPSTDGTEDVLEEFAGGGIRVVRCPEANLARSRNLGIAAAAGDVVAFIDDDALPESPSWLTVLVAPFTADVTLGGSGGVVLSGDTAELEFDGGATSEYGLQVFGATAGDRRGGEWFRRVNGCNCAFRRDVLLRIGGFDEAYSYFADETDVCLRVIRAGFEVRMVAGAAVRHYRAPSRTRRSFHDKDWHVIARSDAYFALKNARDPLPRRLLTTIRLLPARDPIRHIGLWYRAGLYGPDRRALYLARALRGFVSGLWRGMTHPRQTALRSGEPAAFLAFRKAQPERRLRIGLLCRTYGTAAGGGIATYTRELAHGLHALGHEVHVVTESGHALRREGVRWFVHGIVPEGVPLTHSLPLADRALRWSVAAARRVIELARDGTVLDLVESPSWDAEGVAVRRSGLLPLVVRLHSPLTVVAETHALERTPDLEAAIALERWLIASADGVTSSTDAVVRTVRETMNLDATRIGRHARIPLGLPPGASASSAGEGPPRLLFVGRLEPRKGITTLLEAVPGLLARRPDLRVDLVGPDGPPTADGATSRARFEAEHREAPWRRRCQFHGAVDDETLGALYRRCTIFVAPSRYESFGLVHLEAMRLGRPVIGCHTAGTLEVVRDGETGLLVPPDDPAALAAAVDRLLDDPALRRQLGKRARDTVRAEFSSRAMAERMARFYAEVLQQGGDRYRTALEALRGEPLDLDDRERATFRGEWRIERASDGAVERVTDVPGSTFALAVPFGRSITLAFTGDPRSGVASCTVGGERRYLDLYRPDRDTVVRWEVADAADSESGIRCVVALESEANPMATGRELRLRGALTRPAAAERSP